MSKTIIFIFTITFVPAIFGQASREDVISAFSNQGLEVNLEDKTISFPVRICQLREPLEYLLVLQPQGKDHESLLYSKDLDAEALNAAMILLGAVPGRNGQMVEKKPEDNQLDKPSISYIPPAGNGFYIYVDWILKSDSGFVEKYRYRAEDLVLNVREERTYQRRPWVYLGSRFVRPHKDAKEFFAAQGIGNLISLVHFDGPADYLLAGADTDGFRQSVWYPNIFLLPPIDTEVKLTFKFSATNK